MGEAVLGFRGAHSYTVLLTVLFKQQQHQEEHHSRCRCRCRCRCRRC